MKFEELKLIDRFLIQYAKSIDNLDMYTGPFFEAARFGKSHVMQNIAFGARVFEYGIMKIPFMGLYVLRTKDFVSFLDWAHKEIFAVTVPGGGLLQIFRRYEKRTLSYYKREYQYEENLHHKKLNKRIMKMNELYKRK